MQVFEIVLGAVLLIVAAISVVVAVDTKSVTPLGVWILCGAFGGFFVYHGLHGEHAKFKAKHDAILADVRNQGFQVTSDDVRAVGGHYYFGTEVDVTAGTCVLPLIARKVDGTWRLVLPATTTSRQAGGVRIVHSSDLERLAALCP